MSVLRRANRTAASPEPARDLPFVDAVAVLAALLLAYAARAAFGSNYPFEWDSIAPFVRSALPVSVGALLLSAAALDLYGRRAAAADLGAQLAAVAYATAVTALVGIYWGGATPPTLPLVLTAAVCLAVCMHGGRRLYWRIAGPDMAPGPSGLPSDG